MTFILTALGFLKGSRPAQLALIILAVALVAFTVAKCTGGNKEAAKQVEQTSRSSEAIADAAQDAVETITNRSDADLAIDAATAAAKKEIGNAQSPAAIRAAVVRAMCVRPAYRLDPACQVLKPAP